MRGVVPQCSFKKAISTLKGFRGGWAHFGITGKCCFQLRASARFPTRRLVPLKVPSCSFWILTLRRDTVDENMLFLKPREITWDHSRFPSSPTVEKKSHFGKRVGKGRETEQRIKKHLLMSIPGLNALTLHPGRFSVVGSKPMATLIKSLAH